MEKLGEEYEALHRAFAWFIRRTVQDITGVDALTEQTINSMIEDYKAEYGYRDDQT